MKRTSFLLASLTAIVLLSCSNDNLNPLAEDVNLSQTQALQKAPVEITPYGTGTVNSGNYGPMSISNVPTGSTVSSTMATCKFPSVSGTITKVECCLGTSSGTGSFTPQSMRIYLAGKNTTVSMTGSCATTSYFNGSAVPTSCDAYFTGKCTSGPCTRSYSYNYCVISYTY